MPRYRVDFTREWIRGRWGFTDRVFWELHGYEVDSSHLLNAWVVDFRGGGRTLGKYLSEVLNIQAEDFTRFGTIFDIIELESPAPPPRRPRTRRPQQDPAERTLARLGKHHPAGAPPAPPDATQHADGPA